MFDWPFDFLSVLIAIVALLVARKALNRVDELRTRLEAMQSFAAAATARPLPPPVPPTEAERAPPLVVEPPIAHQPPAPVAEAIQPSTTP